MKDLLKILPMIDPLVLLEITGSQIIRCLENGVSMHPKLEGRFPQVTHFFIHIYPACLCDFKIDKGAFNNYVDQILTNFAWPDHKIVLQIKAKQFYDQAIQELRKNREIQLK